MKKYCTKCGKPFDAVGREVICPACKAQAAAETKKAAVMRAKRASWTGESVPVRISGRASTVIRWFASSQTMSFAEALDTLIKSTDYYAAKGIKWADVEPYRSHRRDKHATEGDPEDKPQGDPEDKPQGVKQAARASKPTKTAKASK